MADLDDFFAKKDRKKAKGKKFTTTEEIAKKLEETGKRVEKIKLKEKLLNVEEEEPQQLVEDDEEWKEFEEEKKDYTGLKLGNLQSNDNFDCESDDERGTGENSSDRESSEAANKQSGPWKKADLPKPPPTPEVEVAPPSNVIGGVYKPPHLKNQSANLQMTRPRMKNVAPDIRSEEYFPTLNAKQPQVNESAGPWNRRKRDEGTFEEVRARTGGRSYGIQETQSQAPQLSLDNKYGSLPQDQS